MRFIWGGLPRTHHGCTAVQSCINLQWFSKLMMMGYGVFTKE